MQFTLKSMLVADGFLHRAIAAAIVASLSMPMMARAESAYIQQTTGTTGPQMSVSTSVAGPSFAAAASSPMSVSLAVPPEMTVPHGNAANFAQSLVVGNFNNVTQIQAGRNDMSSVSVIGGNHNNVDVLQGGNNLQSNIVLLGTQGLNLDILQPMGSLPVELLIARLPNGQFVVRR
jgi:hypothetical protein